MSNDDNELLEDWLKIAESTFDFWNNEDDDVYNDYHKYRVLGIVLESHYAQDRNNNRHINSVLLYRPNL